MAYKRIRIYTSWDELPLFLDLSLVAQVLGYSYDRTKKLAHDGVIPARKFGKDYRISKADFINWFENLPIGHIKEVS